MLIDCVIYCGEIDFYKARVEYLHDVVDKFIVIESKTYHNGKQREVDDFYKNIENFPYKDKIIYKLIDCNDCFNLEMYKNYSEGEFFARENYQRNYIKTILEEHSEFNDNDKICICDIDEIPSVDFLKNIKDETTFGVKQFCFIGLDFYYYNHTVHFKDEFYQPIIAFVNYIKNNKDISKQRRKTLYNNIFCHHAGWHLSYFMSTDDIINKISSFAHYNWFTDDKYKSKDIINEKIRNRQNLFNDNSIFDNVNTNIPEIFLQFENFGTE